MSRIASKWLLAGLLVLALAACPDRATTSTVDASASASDAIIDDASVDAGADAVDAAVTLTELPINVQLETDAGLLALEFKAGAAEIDPATVFVLTSPVVLKDFRVRLIDWNDQVVSSDDSASLDGGLSYRLVLTQPTKAGRTYTLVIDAELGPLLVDRAGQDWDDVRRTLTVRGELQPENGHPAKKKPAHRR